MRERSRRASRPTPPLPTTLCLPCVVTVDPSLVARHISAAAARLTLRRDEFTDGLLTLFAAEIAPLQHDDDLLGLLAASTEENVVSALHVLEHGLDPRCLDAPTAAKQYARRLAQRGIAASALLRSYRLGHGSFFEALLQELSAEPGLDPVLAGALGVELSRVTTAYIDTVSEIVVAEYEKERETWAQTASAARAARIRELISGESVDVSAAETELGYRLGQSHVAALMWFESRPRTGDGLVRLERAATAVAEGRPYLLAPTDEGSAAVWFPLPKDADSVRSVADSFRALKPSNLRVALGRGGEGLAGFQLSHLQATQAKQVALAAGDRAARVTQYADVGAVALLCSDLGATRAWVCDTLGPLAADDEGAERLRETLRVFLGAGSSYTAAAEQLMMHKNSVQYRVQKAEQLRGRPIRPDRADVEFALRACQLLGAVVLSHESS